jgi:hypothetical protein
MRGPEGSGEAAPLESTAVMQINTVPAGNGMRWLLEGGRLLRRQPLGLPAMVVVYLMLLLVPAIVPLVGLAISGVLSPFATVGLMQCFREAAQGRAPSPIQFAQPFQDERQRQALFRLGLINAGLLIVVAVLASLIAPQPEAPPGPESIEELPLRTLLAQLLLYSPVMLLMWFAPLLAGWHDMTPGKAMFGSAIACLRNMGALIVYGMGAIALTVGVSLIVVTALTAVVTSREVLSFLLAPIALLLMTIVQGSFYPMYLSIFATQPALTGDPEQP